MALQIQGNGGVVAEVDSSWRGVRTSTRPLDHLTLGHYRVGLQSGLMTSAAVTAGGTVFSVRWTSSTALMVITYLKAYYRVTTVFTAVQEIGLDAILARVFTAADSGGTAVTIAASNQKMRTTMGTTLVTSASSMRISSTGIVTPGTRTLDNNPIASASGLTHELNPAAATVQLIPSIPLLEIKCDVASGEHPIVLAQDEGLVVRNTIVFPAAGAARLCVLLAWAEVASY